MATEGPLITDGSQCTASADLSAKQFYLVKLNTSGRQVVIGAANSDNVYGVLQSKPKAGEAANVGIFGISKAVAGAAITAGDPLMSDTSGRVITQTSTNPKVGVALEAATVTGQIITIKVIPTPG